MRWVSQRRRCPACGTRVERGSALCSACGCRLSSERASEHCPQCGARMGAHPAACPICGAARAAPRPAPWRGLVWAGALLLVVLGCAAAVAWLRPWQWLSATVARLDLNQLPLALTATATASPFPSRPPQPTATPSRTATPSLTASAAPTRAPTLAPTLTARPTQEPSPPPVGAPTSAPTAPPATPTLRHMVAAGDTPLGIALRYGLALGDLLRLNGLSEGVVLQIGQELVVAVATPPAAAPSPAATAAVPLPAQPAAAGGLAPPPTATATSLALAVGGPSPSTTDAAAPFSAATVTPSSVGAASATPGELVHVVQSGDMLGSLAVKYDVTSEAIAKANGIALTTMLQVGQRLIIPGISAQPTATATPPPTSTPTVTPTLSPTLPPRDEGAQLKYLTPLLLAPVSGGVIEDTAQAALLNWASVGILAEREWYELSLWAPGEEGARQFYTKATSQRLDPAQRAADVPASAYAWQVRVVYRDAITGRVVALSPPSERYGFTWQ